MNKKVLSLLFAFILVFSLSMALTGCAPDEEVMEPSDDMGEGMEEVVEMVKITVGTDAAYPPFELIDEDSGEITGFDIDLMNKIAETGGFEVEYKNVNWDGIFVGLDNEDYDAIISACSITDERKELYDFTDPYYAISQALIVPIEDVGAIADVDDLAGKKVGAQIGTTGAIFIGGLEDVELVNYDDNALAIEALLRGDVDAVVCDHPVAYDYALVNESYVGKLEVVNDNLNEGDLEDYGIVVKKGNTAVLDLVNENLAKVLDEGIEDIEKKWNLK